MKRFFDKIPRWLLFVIAVAPAALSIVIFVFIARFALAHDEAKCPFHEVETRTVSGGAAIREESRRCLPEVEEHRWIAVRNGRTELELGRFPLEASRIARGFPWEAVLEDGRMIVTVMNEGRGEVVFREPPPDGMAPWQPAR